MISSARRAASASVTGRTVLVGTVNTVLTPVGGRHPRPCGRGRWAAGGVAGGMSAATRLRRLDESAEIVVLERSGHVSYANCGLPYHLGGVIAERDALLLQTPESLRERFALDVRVRHEVVGVDAAARTVTVRDLASGEVYAETYDHLVLSPGAAPSVPDVPGVKRARTLRTVEDPDALLGALAAAPRTAIVKVFGLTVAVTGWNGKRARAAGRDHRVVHTHPASHAGYYPGAAPMALKLVFDPGSGEIPGAQAVGTEGVDKRVDVIATAMRAGLTAPELADLELAYAPPFGSAKDPVNMLGYVAANLADGTTQSVQWHELEEAVAAGAHLVDVRTAGEFAAGHVPGAVNVPLDELREHAGELPAGPLVVYCGVGVGVHTATRLLTGLGRRVANLDGGYATWKTATAAAA
ncbi:hypothetical protein GCM10010466_67530 [Planomonospora alba]|uniref:Rhodanese domain-containing protein n=1 Tax=Planomonospora alba TaxID=161354 RepID=A0ABP6P506_9ACTN